MFRWRRKRQMPGRITSGGSTLFPDSSGCSFQGCRGAQERTDANSSNGHRRRCDERAWTSRLVPRLSPCPGRRRNCKHCRIFLSGLLRIHQPILASSLVPLSPIAPGPYSEADQPCQELGNALLGLFHFPSAYLAAKPERIHACIHHICGGVHCFLVSIQFFLRAPRQRFGKSIRCCPGNSGITPLVILPGICLFRLHLNIPDQLLPGRPARPERYSAVLWPLPRPHPGLPAP